MGRKARSKRQTALNRIRQRRADLTQAGVQWTERVVGVTNGRPRLADGRTLDVRNVIWCTGYDFGLSFIDLPIFGPDGEPRHASGLVESEPGLYFVGQHFQHSVSSTMIHGVGRDAARMAGIIRERVAQLADRSLKPEARRPRRSSSRLTENLADPRAKQLRGLWLTK
jgi:putative flavoprotein involved in K+ transport